jgi:hypothetical protein
MRISGRDYEPDRIWSRLRTVHNIDITGYGTQASLESAIIAKFRIDKYLGNLGDEGRKQIVSEAMRDWHKVPAETKLVPLMGMRERGLLTAYEFHELAREQGLSEGSAEYQYRKWRGTEEAIYDLKAKGLLRYGEFTKLRRAKRLSRGQAYYRLRKHQALKYGVPFRGFEKKSVVRPRSRYKRQP